MHGIGWFNYSWFVDNQLLDGLGRRFRFLFTVNYQLNGQQTSEQILSDAFVVTAKRRREIGANLGVDTC